jgi:hypothetical protein
MSRSAIPSISTDAKRELDKLREANKALKLEVSTLRAANDAIRQYEDQSPSPSVPTGPRNKSHDKTRTSTMTRHHSASAVETIDRVVSSSRGGTSSGLERSGTSAGIDGDEQYKPDLKWQVRLQELEYKLKAEREARKLDRNAARQRLEEKSRENAELAAEVERTKLKAEMKGS